MTVTLITLATRPDTTMEKMGLVSLSLLSYICLYRTTLPAFVTTDHIAIIVRKSTNAPGYISSIASILRSADSSSTGSLIKIWSSIYAYFILTYKN